MVNDPFDLQRFVDAQEGVYAAALSEIQRGAKRGHWMWFIFPQLRGLGHSAMARRFAIGSLEEARAYLAHPVLGTRLRECVESLQDLTGRSAADVFGEIDAMKLRSSLTLFKLAEGGPIFDAALARWFGSMDERTADLFCSLSAAIGPLADGPHLVGAMLGASAELGRKAVPSEQLTSELCAQRKSSS